MAGQGGFNRDHGRFLVAHLADHDDIRVLTQHGAQAGGERHAGPVVDHALRDAGQFILHRVFDGQNVLLAGVQFGEDGVQRRGLA